MVMHMGLAAFNRRRRELAAAQKQQEAMQKQGKQSEKPTAKGGRKNGKARKIEDASGDRGNE